VVAKLGRGGRVWVAVTQLAVACVIVIGIWAALPARYWLVDGVGTALAALYGVTGIALLVEARWAHSLARVTSWLALLAGAAATTALAWSAAHLAGLYGPVGSGGALLLGTIALLVLPYLVALPAVQLALLRRD